MPFMIIYDLSLTSWSVDEKIFAYKSYSDIEYISAFF